MGNTWNMMFGLKALTTLTAAAAAFVPALADAQTSPRIVMRRPLNPSSTAGTVSPPCGIEGQPACPTQCDFVGAVWDVGQWQGDVCGSGGTVTRSVTCMGVRVTGERVPQDDAFCLQDAAAFRASCNSSPSMAR